MLLPLTSCKHDRLTVRTLTVSIRGWYCEGVLLATLQTIQLATVIHSCITGHCMSVCTHCLASVGHCIWAAVPTQHGWVTVTVDWGVELRGRTGCCRGMTHNRWMVYNIGGFTHFRVKKLFMTRSYLSVVALQNSHCWCSCRPWQPHWHCKLGRTLGRPTCTTSHLMSTANAGRPDSLQLLCSAEHHGSLAKSLQQNSGHSFSPPSH